MAPGIIIEQVEEGKTSRLTIQRGTDQHSTALAGLDVPGHFRSPAVPTQVSDGTQDMGTTIWQVPLYTVL